MTIAKHRQSAFPALPMPDTPYVAPLTSVGGADLARAGGKAANLGELLAGHFPVPAGYVVTTMAYERLMAAHGLDALIRSALEAPDGGDTIRIAIEAAAMPPEVGEDILVAYRALGAGAVAVRSSATAEDLPDAAFAGQQDTYLNIIGEPEVLDAVRRCWASLWTDRAIAYRQRHGIESLSASMAVVVQRMVDADVAGVLFTANPVTGARNEVVIDASSGLGESVVSGLVTPDHFVVHKPTGWIKERRAGRHEVVIRALEGGGTEHVTAAEPGGRVLGRRALRQLTRLGAAIEQHFGAPQDIEWAWAEGKPFIVQARPITALPGPPPHPNRVQRQLLSLVTEMLPIRPYPLDVSTWSSTLWTVLTSSVEFFGIKVAPFTQLCTEQDGVVVKITPELTIRPTRGILLAPVRLARSARRYDPCAWQDDPLLTGFVTRARVLEARDLTVLSWDQLLEHLRETLSLPSRITDLRIRYFPPAVLAIAKVRLLLGLLRRGEEFGAVVWGIETKTAETNRALEALAARIRSDPALAAAFTTHPADQLLPMLKAQPSVAGFVTELRAFLDTHGHRETTGALVATQPTWKDAPEVVLGMLGGLAAAPPRHAPRSSGTEARTRVLAHPVLRLPPLRRAFVSALDRARRLQQIREDTHYYATLVLPGIRHTMLEFGRRLAEVGLLDAAADVVHLTFDELALIDAWPPPQPLRPRLQTTVAQRRDRRMALADTPLLDPRVFTSAKVGGDALVQGTPGSPGVAEGPARVIWDATDFARLQPGDVLVAPYTNPAWTPLFQYVAAAVVDTGAAGSHAAIVAREYHIPAVMGTRDGTDRIVDGTPLRVDGDRGLVFALGSPDSTAYSAGS